MKVFITSLIAAIVTSTVRAAPGSNSLKRAFKVVRAEPVNALITPAPASPSDDTMTIACVECPCDGWTGDCACVYMGCCCDWTVLPQPPAETWLPKA
ncbi:hypothetical protein J1614_011059 [Plenodomus biglobosus]|nr:hypothetical protein J1614_011059 [Plenodomus biglobosus]